MELSAIYLQDHLALSFAGVRLARRCARENAGTEVGRTLAAMIPELEEDRQLLRDLLRALGGGPSAVKTLALAAGEWAGRWKLNGRLLTYSPLSRLWELEALVAGSESRRGLWKALAHVSKRDPRLRGFALEVFEERAREQKDRLERLRVRAAVAAFAPAGDRAQAAIGGRAPPVRAQ